MQSSEQLYCNIAFFFHRNAWYYFLIKAVIPYLEKNKDKIHRFYLSLAQARGYHIMLTYLVDKNDAQKFTEKLDSYFQDFIMKHPSSLASVKYPTGMYMDFANNSIHYGIFDLVIKAHDSDVFNFYHSEVSKVLLSIFKSYKEETLENLTEIIMEMFAWFCKVVSINVDRSIKLFEDLLENSYKKYEGSLLDKMRINNEENFEDNKEPILEYIYSFFNQPDKEIEYEYEWQQIWVETVQEVKQRLSIKETVAIDNEDYKYLLASIPTIFAVENKSQVYHLFLNGLKEIQKVTHG